MTKKLNAFRVIVFTIILAAGIFSADFLARLFAGDREIRLEYSFPTTRMVDSKRLNVFVSRVIISPSEFEIDSLRYYVADPWIERWSAPNRINRYITRQEIFDDFVVCVPLLAVDEETGEEKRPHDGNIMIKGGKTDNFPYSASNNVYFFDAGAQIPERIFFISSYSSEEVVCEINIPNQSAGDNSGRRGAPTSASHP